MTLIIPGLRGFKLLIHPLLRGQNILGTINFKVIGVDEAGIILEAEDLQKVKQEKK